MFQIIHLFNHWQKHPFRDVFRKSRSSRPEVFCKKGVLRNFTKITVKHPCQSLFFNKVAGLRIANLLKERLWHKCFTVNFLKFLKNTFFHRAPLFLPNRNSYLLSYKAWKNNYGLQLFKFLSIFPSFYNFWARNTKNEKWKYSSKFLPP